MKHILILFMVGCMYSCTTTTSDKYQESESSDTLTISPADSIAATKLALNFYIWYADGMKKDTLRPFDPVFIKDANGYTALDFSSFEKDMQKLNFTDDYIKRVKDHYSYCIENLKGLPYDSIMLLKEPERINMMRCNFIQDHLWNYSMFKISGAEIIRIEHSNSKNIHVIIHTYSDIDTDVTINITPEKKHQHNYMNRVFEEEEWAVKTIKEGDQWKIQDIDIVPTTFIPE